MRTPIRVLPIAMAKITPKNTSHSSPEMSCEPISRPAGILTTLSGTTSCRSTPASKPLTPSFIEPTSCARAEVGADPSGVAAP
ncbi:hypothetical protein AB1285_12400 [Microbacterium sp. NRRL B-14842]|uniref:hypothetical protein n=1 Tax=Microbacterium sp. NRRL B-14842 TaxID=3162881 RepID=UPI003D280841